QPAVESAVTRLLVSIKQLLESLTRWSNVQASEEDVSDVYVRLGNDFNAAVAAFASYNIDMSELLSVPDDLRTVLEDCLSEEPSQTTLEKYLPKVRGIITSLLQGLRAKQTVFRQIVPSSKHRSDASGHSRTESRQSRGSSKRDTREESTSRRNTQASVASSVSTSARRRTGGDAAPPAAGLGEGGEPFVGGFSPELSQPVPSPTPPLPTTSPAPPSTQSPPPSDRMPSPPQPQRTSQPPVPATVKRYSLVDAPAPPTVVIESASASSDLVAGPSSPPPTDPEDAASNPYVASSLAALKQSDALERRASKRFSTYNISKIAGSLPPSMRAGPSAREHPNRRSIVAGGGTLTAGELAALTEADDDVSRTPSPQKRQRSKSSTRRAPLQDISEEQPPVPPLPAPAVREPPQSGGPATVFMQVGREVKKARVELGGGLSFAGLRVMFVEKFAYNPGQGNFPAIYIRDPSSGVSYELEDMEEIKDGCLLSLNIEPLDQIKEHIDTQISGLAQELRDLKKAVNDQRRSSVMLPSASGPPAIFSEMQPSFSAPPRPSDSQLRTVARRLSRLVSDHPMPSQALPLQPQDTGATLMPQYTGMSTISEASGRIVADLRTQFDEVQNLRRDLGIMRQLYTEFAQQTKEALGGLRAQTAKVREMAATHVPGARAYIEEGKGRLDSRSQTVLQKMEELQDTVEQIKDDVLKRHVSPKPAALKDVRDDLGGIDRELQSLKEMIETVKPMWKKTWEEELQGVVEEQQFLQHQEGFVLDLLEDLKATVEIFGHVEKVISIRGSAGSRGRGKAFRPPPLDEGHNGLSTVMLEIQGAAVDPEKRMKAIAASQKNRERELKARGDEFESELKVGQARLNKTGGAEEAERTRQRKNEMTLKAMFNGGQGSPLGSNAPLSPTSPGPEVEDAVTWIRSPF
ncbi:actin interacting protein 3-domain-containing protein, partial [Vararia minispora EC-137]